MNQEKKIQFCIQKHNIYLSVPVFFFFIFTGIYIVYRKYKILCPLYCKNVVKVCLHFKATVFVPQLYRYLDLVKNGPAS